MNLSTALRVVRASAVYDLVVTGAFALPWTVGLAFQTVGWTHGALGLSGALPSTDTVFTALFANLMGSVVVVWSVVRLLRPSLALGVADTCARFLFSLGMGAALVAGGSTVLVGLLVVEVAWGVVQGAVMFSALRSGDGAVSGVLGSRHEDR
ncbi:hypothetical protein ACWFMI_16240 [Nocardiopsis terrae]